jgi:hypothetical protein
MEIRKLSQSITKQYFKSPFSSFLLVLISSAAVRAAKSHKKTEGLKMRFQVSILLPHLDFKCSCPRCQISQENEGS